MTFKEGYRLEKVYFENIYTLLNMLKSVDKNNVDMNTVKELLDNAIADNESIILIYKNLGELYSEVADNYSKLLADLEALKENLESWKDEINEKIDDLNNYIMSLIRDIEQRLDSLEQRMSDAEDAIDSLEDRMDTAEADIDALEGRMDTAEDDIDALEGRMDTAEDDIDSLEGRMDTAEDDIDDLETNKQDKLTAGNGITIDSNNEISVDTSVVQPKLTEGFGINIDSNNEISVDTNDVQEKLIAGQNITLTPDTTDPTKTVIDASGGGSSYSAGKGIEINNNVISNVAGLFNMNGLTKINGALTTDVVPNFAIDSALGNGAISYYESKSLDNIDGLFFMCSLRSAGKGVAGSDSPALTSLKPFDNNAKVKAHLLFEISNKADLNDSSQTVYYRRHLEETYEVDNNTIVVNSAIAALSSYSSKPRYNDQICNLLNSFSDYVRFGKQSGLYLHIVYLYDIIRTSKTLQEWETFVKNTVSGWGNTGSIPFIVTNAYSSVE